MGHGEGRERSALVVVGRGVDVRGDGQAAQLVRDRVDVDLARLVAGDRVFVDEAERARTFG
jgi:hypothetical protein